MDELRNVLDDVLCGKIQRSYLSRRHLGNGVYIDYAEEDAPQLIDFQHYGSDKTVRIGYYKHNDGLTLYVDGEYRQQLQFEHYKNKTAYAAAIAVWVDRYAC